MSISDANLMIEHSGAECDAEYVMSKFDQIFDPGFVLDVIEEVITAGAKKFYLIVDQDHPALMRLTDLIHENTFAAVVYKKEWNKTTRKYTEVYWKVVAHYPVFIPYLANEEQFAEMFAPQPMIRCDSVEMPGPSMLERSTNEPRIDSIPRPEEYADLDYYQLPKAMERSESDGYATQQSEYETPKPMERSESDGVAPPPLFRAMSVATPSMYRAMTEEDRASYKSTEGDSLVPKSLFRSFDESWRP
jgi:hypothetical protein